MQLKIEISTDISPLFGMQTSHDVHHSNGTFKLHSDILFYIV